MGSSVGAVVVVENCADAAACATSGDCQSGVCTGGICQAAACGDGVKNGTETDIDCGGTCGPCGVGKTCIQAADCAPALCSANKCGLGTGADGPLIVPVGR